jgi:hypothetical protein
MMNRIYALLSAAALLFVVGAVPAQAGDKNSTWFSSRSNLVGIGFTGAACGKIPTPWVEIDGEANCAKVPLTYMYKQETIDGDKYKEVRKLEDTHTETMTVAPDGTQTMSLKVVSGRSVDGNFGRRQAFSVTSLAWGDGKSDSRVARTFATGLAAARRSTQDPITAPE